MIDFSLILTGLQNLFTGEMFLMMLFGVAFGIITGAIPGFSSPMAMIVMLPYSYRLSPEVGVVLMGAIFLGSCFGGSISAILLGIPGTPQAIATTFDGYPLAKTGKANEALGMALGASTFGSFLGTIALLIIMKPLGDFAIKFGASEMFMVIIMGLSVLGTLSSGNMIRGIMAGVFGILLGTIGTTMTGQIRGTFGLTVLMDGIPQMATLIGLIAIPEILSLMDSNMHAGSSADFRPSLSKMLHGIKIGCTSWFNNIRSAIIGIIIGILPGAGGMFATIVAYDQEKKASKCPETYGKGNPQGVVAAETANNASQGGSYAILMALGIPGGSATAVLYGALLVHNYVPGPTFVSSHMDFCYTVILSLFACTLIMLVLGAAMSMNMASILRVPLKILLPLLVVFALVGTYSDTKVFGHLWVMVILGIISYHLKTKDFPLMSIILGIILGDMAETYYVRMLQIFKSPLEVFRRPLFLVLFIITIIGVFSPKLIEWYKKKNNITIHIE